jgi:hypothetical protein
MWASRVVHDNRILLAYQYKSRNRRVGDANARAKDYGLGLLNSCTTRTRVSIFVHAISWMTDQKSKSWTRKSDGFGGLAELCAKMHAYTYMQM